LGAVRAGVIHLSAITESGDKDKGKCAIAKEVTVILAEKKYVCRLQKIFC
jgi:hypothetical protein